MNFRIHYHVIPHDHSIIGPKGHVKIHAESIGCARNILILGLTIENKFNPELDDLWVHMKVTPSSLEPHEDASAGQCLWTLPPQSDAPEGL